MSKTILRKVPDEDVYYNYEDEIELDDTKIIIYGNSRYKGFGDEELISVISGDYYDDETGYDYDTFEQLKKITGKTWKLRTMKGYSQGDWNYLYYTDDVYEGFLDEIENFYMGKVSEFTVQEEDDEESIYHVFVPDSIVWKGKNSICEYLGIDPTDTKVYTDDGYERVIRYKEIY